jgi:hypothetical protein
MLAVWGRYRLPQFAQLVTAFREGNVADFDEALEMHQACARAVVDHEQRVRAPQVADFDEALRPARECTRGVVGEYTSKYSMLVGQYTCRRQA